MKAPADFPRLLAMFFSNHLMQQREASPHTIASYRDTFRLLVRYAQRELSLRVLEQGGDYFWVVKDNQPGVREAVSLFFEQPPWGERFGESAQEGRRGDRGERRRLRSSTALNEYLD